jgi:hypothetical protein
MAISFGASRLHFAPNIFRLGCHVSRECPGGDVVLDLSVSTSGAVVHSAAVYNVPALTNSVVSAANLWKFDPGTLNGTPIFANVVAAFVFRAPAIKRTS